MNDYEALQKLLVQLIGPSGRALFALWSINGHTANTKVPVAIDQRLRQLARAALGLEVALHLPLVARLHGRCLKLDPVNVQLG